MDLFIARKSSGFFHSVMSLPFATKLSNTAKRLSFVFAMMHYEMEVILLVLYILRFDPLWETRTQDVLELCASSKINLT